MLYLAISQRHKGCNHNSHLILTLITGETCSKLSVMNNRWRSCTHRTVISTLRSLSRTRTHLLSAVPLDVEAVNDLFLTSKPYKEGDHSFPCLDGLDRLDCLLLVCACPPFKLPFLVAFRLSSTPTFALYFYPFFRLVVPRLFKLFTRTYPHSPYPGTKPSCTLFFFSSPDIVCSLCLLSTHCSLYRSPLPHPLVQIVEAARGLSLNYPLSISNL